ncbi:MAG TPA: polysaccharide biosynthesis tyrosine autokinase, partial [Flavobacteriaceae bacterium]|nr:polysaccharide biosynthesis tyrosine autokinase [Flavobacteriaceae bacterium]
TIYKYLYYWPWFVGSVLLALILAGLYLRYTTDIYQTTSEIKILDANEGGLDLSGLQGGGPLWDMSDVNLQNEIQIITSRRLLAKVVDELDLNTRYYSTGQIKSVEVWKTKVPFKVLWHLHDSIVNGTTSSPYIQINFASNSTFRISTEEIEQSKKYNFGELVNLNGYAFEVVLNPYYEQDYGNFRDYDFSFIYTPTEALLSGFQGQLTVEPVNEQSDILKIVYKGPNIAKNEAIIDKLVEQFNEDGIEDKRLVSKNTAEFIDLRLQKLVKELDTVETNLVEFKQDRDLVTIESTSSQLFAKEGLADMEHFKLNTQLSITQSFKEELLSDEGYQLLPANLGIESSSINNLTEAYNEAVLSRQKLMISATEESPAVQNLDRRLETIKQNIFNSIDSYLKSLKISLENFKDREAISSSSLNAIPKTEKGLRVIRRQQEIKEKLFLFLLQKREEAALTYAITSPTVKVVDYAYTEPGPIAPQGKIIFLAALVLGLLIPFGILYVLFLLNTKIEDRAQVKKHIGDIPILAEIPQLEKGSLHVIRPNDRSVLAESFRVLRTNINYFKPLNKADDEGQVIFVTSTAKGEGKTFTSVNLAITLATASKRVLLVGSDLRNPKLHNYIKEDKNRLGTSSYLYDESVQFSDLIIKSPLNYSNLDVILSGNVPPNPAELLSNNRFEQMLNEAKAQYDYVIVDTAPTILVTDTLLTASLADITVYIVRAGFTDQKLLEHVKDLHKFKKMNNICIVISGLKDKGRYGYNYGHGYGYEETPHQKHRFRFWKNRS